MLQGPGKLWVDIKRQHTVRLRRIDHLLRGKTVKAHQPVGLIQPVLTHQGWTLQRQNSTRIGNRAERRIIDTPQTKSVIQAIGAADDVAIGRCICPHNHLRRLTCRREIGCAFIFLLRVLAVEDRIFQPAHCAFNAFFGLFRRERVQPGACRQFDVDRQPVRMPPSCFQQFRIGIGNGLEMDIAAKVMILAQAPRDLNNLLHRVIRTFDDPR